jgi:hypothetical protein
MEPGGFAVHVEPALPGDAPAILALHRRALEEARAIAALLLERQAALERAATRALPTDMASVADAVDALAALLAAWSR